MKKGRRGMPDEVEERNETEIKMLNRRTRTDTENYKKKRRQDKKMFRAKKKKKDPKALKVLKSTKEANKRNETRKFYTIAHRMKVGFQPRKSICTERDNNLIGNIRLIMESLK